MTFQYVKSISEYFEWHFVVQGVEYWSSTFHMRCGSVFVVRAVVGWSRDACCSGVVLESCTL